MIREPGYYWVIFDNRKQIAEYLGDSWLVIGIPIHLADKDFKFIYPDKICNP